MIKMSVNGKTLRRSGDFARIMKQEMEKAAEEEIKKQARRAGLTARSKGRGKFELKGNPLRNVMTQ